MEGKNLVKLSIDESLADAVRGTVRIEGTPRADRWVRDQVTSNLILVRDPGNRPVTIRVD